MRQLDRKPKNLKKSLCGHVVSQEMCKLCPRGLDIQKNPERVEKCVCLCVLVALPVRKNINQPVLNCYCSARTTKYKNTALHKLPFP